MFNLISLVLTLNSSMFYQTQYYTMDNYDTITHNIPCEEVNAVCFEKSKVEYVKFDFLDNVNYSETHYFTNKIEYRYDKLKKHYKTTKEPYDTLDYGFKYSAFSDNDFDYIVKIDKAPFFIGCDCKVVSITKTLRFFK